MYSGIRDASISICTSHSGAHIYYPLHTRSYRSQIIVNTSTHQNTNSNSNVSHTSVSNRNNTQSSNSNPSTIISTSTAAHTSESGGQPDSINNNTPLIPSTSPLSLSPYSTLPELQGEVPLIHRHSNHKHQHETHQHQPPSQSLPELLINDNSSVIEGIHSKTQILEHTEAKAIIVGTLW